MTLGIANIKIEVNKNKVAIITGGDAAII